MKIKNLINLKRINLLLAIIAVALFSQAPQTTTTTYAGGPLANCSSGTPFTWGGGGVNIPFNPDQGDLGPLTNAGATALVQRAFDVWGAVPTSTASYTNAGQLPVDVDITNFGPYLNAPGPDGFSAIVFDDDGQIFDLLFGPGSGILGFAGPEWGTPGNCTIIEGFSFLNGPAFTTATAALDVMVHEFGHYSNLAHTVVNGQIFLAGDESGPSPNDTFSAPVSVTQIETMYPFYFGPGSGTQSLHKDDIASLSTLYPDPGFASSTAAISGTIFAPNGTTRLTGVNVIARNIADPFDDAVSAISSDFTDGTSQADPVVGTYKIEGLTPGASYAVYVDEILAGGFSTPPLRPLPGPEEFYNGANESSDPATDDPSVFTAVPVSAGSTASGTNIIFNAPPPGVIPLRDDDFAEIFLPFSFRICGQAYSSVFVNSNGNLTFGSGDRDFSESQAEFLRDQPRIAPLWDDLNPAQGGTVSFAFGKNSATFMWNGVPEFPATGANTFAVTLMQTSNHIDVVYGGVTARDGIGGVSCGGAITSRFEAPVDLTGYGPSRINLHNQPALYEVWNFSNPTDISRRTVRYNGTTAYNDNWAGKNDTLGTARNIKLPFNSAPIPRYTEIKPTGGDVDYYSFNLEANSTLVAEIQTGGLDTLIGLFDSSGNLVAVDDDGGPGFLSRIIYPTATGGTFTLAVTAFADFDFDGDGGSGGRYVLDVQAVDGIVIGLGDDDSFELPLGFTFPYQGSNYTSVFVNSNGNLTFGSGDPDFTESVAEFLNDQPRIAPLWDDLNPTQGGMITAEFNAGSVTVNYIAIPEWFSTGANSFSVTLNSDGSIDVDYGAMSARDGIAGVTEGGGALNPGESDLSSAVNWSATGTTYERFTGFADPNDLSGLSLIYTP